MYFRYAHHQMIIIRLAKYSNRLKNHNTDDIITHNTINLFIKIIKTFFQIILVCLWSIKLS